MLAAGFASIAQADDPASWDKPLHGVTVTLAPQWTSEYSNGKSAKRLIARCETPACRRTQEICTLVVTDTPIPDVSPFPSAWFVAVTIGADKIRRSALEASHEGSTIEREPASEWIDGQSWYTTETLAPYGWKSLFHATAVIDQRFIRVRCRTCDRTEDRFDFARKFLASIRIIP